MAATTASSPTTITPKTEESSNTNNNRGILSSPWAQVVKGAGELPEPENIPASEGNAVMKPARNTTSNPISPPLPAQSGVDHGVVIEAATWPALSESTRLPLKPTLFSDSFKRNPDVSQEPINSNLHQHKRGSMNSSQNSSINGTAPARQRSMKRGGGGNRQGGYARDPPLPAPLPAFPVPEMAHSSYSKVVPGTGPDLSFRELRPTSGFSSLTNLTNEHVDGRGFNQRGNFGQHGNGIGRNNYHGGWRDKDRRNNDWSSSSSSNARGSRGHPHRPHGQGFMGPAAQGTPHFAALHPVRHHGNAFIYPDSGVVYYYPSPPPDYLRGMPYYFSGPPPPPPYLVASDPLRLSIIKQIEFYFSDANLVKDQFLRSKMDDQGWVPITLIANFPRVQNLTENIPFILDCLGGSSFVEVQGDKVRRCDDWGKWILHQRSPSESGALCPVSSSDNMTSDIAKMSLEEN